MYQTKACTRCRRTKPANQFAKKTGTSTGLHPYCNTCQREKQLLWRYNITLEDYEALLAAQGGVCALCGCKPKAEGRNGANLRVDHDHATGKVRGLLCTRCNVALGTFGDTVEGLEKALRYLKGEPSTSSS